MILLHVLGYIFMLNGTVFYVSDGDGGGDGDTIRQPKHQYVAAIVMFLSLLCFHIQ